MAVAFAFDPKRKAILLVAGDKSGVAEKRFYRELIARQMIASMHISAGKNARGSDVCQ